MHEVKKYNAENVTTNQLKWVILIYTRKLLKERSTNAENETTRHLTQQSVI